MSNSYNEFLERKKKFEQSQKLQQVTTPEDQPNPMGRTSPNVINQANKTADTMVRAIKPNVAPQASQSPQITPSIDSSMAGRPATPFTPRDVMGAVAQVSPDNAKTVVDNLPGEYSVKQQVKKMFDDPALLQQRISEIEQKKADNKPVGMVDGFLDALTFFLPTALGAAVGGLAGGAEGGVAAAKAATDLTGAYRSFNMDRAKMQMQQDLADKELQLQYGMPKYDATPGFIDTRTGKSVTTVSRPGQAPEFVEVGSGNKVSGDFVKPLSLHQAEFVQGSIAGRQDENLNQRQVMAQENALKAFNSSKDMQKTKDVLGSLDQVQGMIESGVPITQDFLSPIVAKGILGQVGVLTEQDAARAKIPMPIFNKVKNNMSEALTGNMTPEAREAAVKMISLMREKHQQRANKLIEGFANQDRVKRLGFQDKQSLVDQLSAQAGIDFNDQRSFSGEAKKVNENKDKLKKIFGGK